MAWYGHLHSLAFLSNNVTFLLLYVPRPRYVPDRQFVQHNDLPSPVGFKDQRVQHVVGNKN